MKNIMLTIEYNGSRFSGWQKQNGKRTVQQQLEDAFFTLTNQHVDVEGSGRTDKGVHALSQIASVKFDCKIPIKNIKYALNNLLDEDVRVKKVQLADESFHARFSAKEKTYRYVVQVGGQRSAINFDTVAYYDFEVDTKKMDECKKLLIGKHNFKGFCNSNTQATNFEREVFDISFKKKGRIFTFDVCGNGFLYNMVRIIVGTILDVGSGKKTLSDVAKAIELGQRKYAGKTMPPSGLYLKEVRYK